MNPLVAGLLASWCVAIISVWVVYPTPRMQPPTPADKCTGVAGGVPQCEGLACLVFQSSRLYTEYPAVYSALRIDSA